MWCQWCGVLAFLTLTTFGLCVPTQSKDEQDWTGIVLLPTVISALLVMKCGPLCSAILPILSPVQFQLESGYQVLPPRRRWDLCGPQLRQLERKHQNFRVIGGEWRCRAQEFLLGLWREFEMAVGSRRSTLGSENRKELKRRDTMICHQCLRQSLIANRFKSRCLSLFLPPIWVGSTEAVWDHLCYWVWFWSWHKM